MADETPYGTDSDEPKSARGWLAMIADAEKAFDDYQGKADNIDALYSDLGKLSNSSRDREFQLFWANVQVLGPSIYARPPVPVVVPKFKDRRPLYRVASELLERTAIVAFDLTCIDEVMLLLRDDLAVVGRGAAWVRYETKSESGKDSERIWIEHLDRKDFLHDPARKWPEVTWVARRGWMTKEEVKKRFKLSEEAASEFAYVIRREDKERGAADSEEKVGIWEIWSKTEDKVVWVTEGHEDVLEEGKPHLKLEGFFPCPKPAYATVQRRSLVPVPDMVYYKDQLEEINELTGRIHALADAIKVRGFYPAGISEVGDAIEAAIKSNDERQVLVPVSNWAAFGATGGDPIIWLPIEMIANVVTGLVELRRQIIDDVYQIMGLSDIMRGSTEASETLGAQQLKSQYGSVRIRDKQGELIRVARDLVRIAAEIAAEEFDKKTLLDMSQMELPTDSEIRKQVKALEDQAQAISAKIEEIQSDPASMEQAQGNPEEAQQMLQQATQQIEQLGQQATKLQEQVTIEQVMEFLRDNKIKAFVLDIETDSTIAPDENAQKQRATEFITAVGGFLAQAIPTVQMVPQSAGFMGDTLKYVASQFRAGREMDTSIDEFAEQMKAMGQQPQANPEADAAKAQQQIEQQKMQMEQQRLQADMQSKQADAQARQQEMELKAQIETAKADADIQLKSLDAQAKQQESQARLEQIRATMQRDAQKGDLEMRKLAMEIERMQIDAALKTSMAAQQADQSERSFEQQTAMNAQKAQEPAE